GALRLAPRSAAERPVATETPLAIPGMARLCGIGTVRATCERRAPAPFPPADALECWLDAAALNGPLTVRLRRPGDRFQPLGMGASMRLQDFLVNARVPRAARDRLPLVVRGNEVVWVVGQRIADWASVRADSGEVVRLCFEPAGGD